MVFVWLCYRVVQELEAKQLNLIDTTVDSSKSCQAGV